MGHLGWSNRTQNCKFHILFLIKAESWHAVSFRIFIIQAYKMKAKKSRRAMSVIWYYLILWYHWHDPTWSPVPGRCTSFSRALAFFTHANDPKILYQATCKYTNTSRILTIHKMSCLGSICLQTIKMKFHKTTKGNINNCKFKKNYKYYFTRCRRD